MILVYPDYSAIRHSWQVIVVTVFASLCWPQAARWHSLHLLVVLDLSHWGQIWHPCWGSRLPGFLCTRGKMAGKPTTFIASTVCCRSASGCALRKSICGRVSEKMSSSRKWWRLVASPCKFRMNLLVQHVCIDCSTVHHMVKYHNRPTVCDTCTVVQAAHFCQLSPRQPWWSCSIQWFLVYGKLDGLMSRGALWTTTRRFCLPWLQMTLKYLSLKTGTVLRTFSFRKIGWISRRFPLMVPTRVVLWVWRWSANSLLVKKLSAVTFRPVP